MATRAGRTRRGARPFERSTTVALVAAVTVISATFAAVPAAADHEELAQEKDYVVAFDAVRVLGLTTGVDCEGDVAGVGVNCVTFDLTGREHQVDVHVADQGQFHLWKADRTVERFVDPYKDQAVRTAKDAYAGTGAPGSDLVNDSLDEAAKDRTRFFFVSGRTFFADADGDVLLGVRTFCGSQTRMNVPTRAAALTVLLDGAVLGNALLSACGTTYSGGTFGTVHMAVPQSK